MTHRARITRGQKDMRFWLWVVTVFDLVLFLPGLWFTVGSLAVPGSSAVALVIRVLAAILPVLSILGPVCAWRFYDKRQDLAAMVMVALPIAYGISGAAILWLWI